MANYPTSPQPLRAMQVGQQHKVLISESEDGYEQRRYIWPKRKRQYQLAYQYLTQTEMQTLVDFYNNTASGTYNSFNFTDPVHSETVVCRFADDQLSYECPFYKKYNMTINLVEVF